jgi:CMP-N,N'-diacetyllegionaminic acid synthase
LKVLGVTLARSGSKGVPGKNIRPINGRPLIAYTIEEALKSKLISDYIISTDSEQIAQVSRELGAEVPFLRPTHLAQDDSPSADALIHAVKAMEDLRGFKYDYVIELMVTNPFKTFRDIDKAVEMLSTSGADSVIAVKRVYDGHPARIKKIIDGKLQDFCVPEILESRRQDLSPPAYIRCGAIYALSRNEIIENGRRYGSDFSLAFELENPKSINIDDEFDLALAELILGRR